MSLHTMSIITSEKPNFRNTFVRKIHDTLSYALVMSKFTTTLMCWFLRLISLIVSYVSNIFSVIFLPLINPNCVGEIILGSTSTILSCTILDIILLIKELKLIDVRSEKLLTSSFLGTNIKLVWVIKFGSVCPQKKHWFGNNFRTKLKEQSWKAIWPTHTISI